jgi:hypothetical protein
MTHLVIGNLFFEILDNVSFSRQPSVYIRGTTKIYFTHVRLKLKWVICERYHHLFICINLFTL